MKNEIKIAIVIIALAVCMAVFSGCTGERIQEPPADTDVYCEHTADTVAHVVRIVCENGRELNVPYPRPPAPYITVVEDEAPGPRCEFGGSVIASGSDYDEDGALSVNEVDDLAFVCATQVCTGG